MSISVTQEEATFRPVTIVIDDERTANMLRYAIYLFHSGMVANNLVGVVNSINSVEDYQVTRTDFSSIEHHLNQFCK